METTSGVNDLVAQLTGTLQARDDLRLEHLKQAASWAAMEQSAMLKEQARLAKKYGASSPQASAAAGRLSLMSQENDALAADIARASLPVPPTEAGKFVVYGRILDAQGNGVRGAKVTATDSKGSVLASGSSKVQGLFEVRVALMSKAKIDRIKGGEAGVPPAPLSFQLVITGGSLEQPYTSPETITVTTGQLAYREITLPETA